MSLDFFVFHFRDRSTLLRVTPLLLTGVDWHTVPSFTLHVYNIHETSKSPPSGVCPDKPLSVYPFHIYKKRKFEWIENFLCIQTASNFHPLYKRSTLFTPPVSGFSLSCKFHVTPLLIFYYTGITSHRCSPRLPFRPFHSTNYRNTSVNYQDTEVLK